jgi:hypothetical protein
MNNSGNPRILALTEGGTGAKTAAVARANLGLEGLTTSFGVGNVQLNLEDLTTDQVYNFPDISAAVGLVLTKTTTGDPTVPEGVFVINVFDNNFKVMADGALRSLATW